MLRRLITVVAVTSVAGAVLAVPTGALASGDAVGSTAPSRQVTLPPAESLLVATFATGTVRPAQGGRLLLEVTPDRGLIGWFSDRPERTAGRIDAAALPRMWPRLGFAADPPEAALVLGDGSSARTSVLELRSPRWADARLSFVARVVKGPRPEAMLGAGSLFIDGASSCPAFAEAQAAATTIAQGFVTLNAQVLAAQGLPTAVQTVGASMFGGFQQLAATQAQQVAAAQDISDLVATVSAIGGYASDEARLLSNMVATVDPTSAAFYAPFPATASALQQQALAFESTYSTCS